MAKDSNNTKLWIGSGLIIDEIHDVLGETTGDLGSLCKSSNINAWARYKPFRNSSKGFEPTSAGASAWATAMTSAGFGFGSAHNNLTFGWNGDSPEWAAFYHNNGKPRGVGGGYNEPYRQLDFADLNSKGSGAGVTTNGYNEAMLPPLKINFPSELEQGGSTITVQKDSNVGNSSVWNSSEGITFNEVLPASLTNYNLAVLFKNGSYGNILVMDYTPATLGTNGASTVMVNGLSIAEGITLPIFDETSSYDHKAMDGDTIKTTVALIPGRNVTTGNYEILYVGGSTDTSHQSYNGDLVSLNLLGGMDSANLTYYTANSIVGTEAHLTATIAPVTTEQGDIKTYRIDDISVIYTTRGPRWGSLQSAKCKIYMSVSNWAWYLSAAGQQDVEPDPAVPYGGDTVLILNSDSQNEVYTEAALNSQDSLPHTTTALTQGNTGGNLHKIRRPYIHFIGGSGNPTITLSGYIFSGSNTTNPPEARRIYFDSDTSVTGIQNFTVTLNFN